jgi:hypothetical protein
MSQHIGCYTLAAGIKRERECPSKYVGCEAGLGKRRGSRIETIEFRKRLRVLDCRSLRNSPPAAISALPDGLDGPDADFVNTRKPIFGP